VCQAGVCGSFNVKFMSVTRSQTEKDQTEPDPLNGEFAGWIGHKKSITTLKIAVNRMWAEKGTANTKAQVRIRSLLR
jgi:hypothetical protein